MCSNLNWSDVKLNLLTIFFHLISHEIFIILIACICYTKTKTTSIQTKLIKIKYWKIGSKGDGMWGTYQIAGAIAGPIVVICLITVACLYYFQNKRNQHHHLGIHEDSIEAPDHPILNSVSLKHMLEMTTSGSGSGTLVIIACLENEIEWLKCL